MKELRSAIKLILQQYFNKIYFQNVPDLILFPHVVYDLPTSFTDEDVEVFNLDVDIYDDDLDTTKIEEISDSIWKGLKSLKYMDENIQISIYRENRLSVNDPDPRINHRKLIFQLRYFDRRLSDV